MLLLPAGLQPAPDLASDYRGPLAGLAGAIGWLVAEGQTPDFVLSAAVDTPFFPADFVNRASAMIAETNADAIITHYADQDYPTNALWRFSAVNDLAERVLAGTAPHSLKRLGIELHARHLDWPT